jgi:hypothetical protein
VAKAWLATEETRSLKGKGLALLVVIERKEKNILQLN